MANCCCGLNTIVNLPVPSGDKGDGPAVNVSGLQGRKTLEVSGAYAGAYWVFGSHDGNLFFPVANFNSGGGSQSVRKTLDVAANFLKVHREAPQSGLVTINVAGRATVPCATSGQGGTNNFFSLAALVPGMSGPQAPLDLFTLVAATGLDVSSVACGGSFTGQISIEGSLDGANLSPVGSFLSSQAQRSSQPGQSAFDPVVVNQIIRFLRVNVLPGTVIAGPTSLTLGGPQNCDCASSTPCTPGLVVFGPTAFPETDERTNPPDGQFIGVVKVIPMNNLCTTPGANFQLSFDAGQINYDGETGGLSINVGGTMGSGLDGVNIWLESTGNTFGWTAISNRIMFNPIATFTLPPVGQRFIKLAATVGSGTIAGYRNYTIRVTVV